MFFRKTLIIVILAKWKVFVLDILDRISKLLNGREQRELTDFLGIKSVAFSEWKSGKSKSYKKYLIEIADFFNVSIDYLVYGKEINSIQDNLSEDEKRLLNMYSQLTDIEKGDCDKKIANSEYVLYLFEMIKVIENFF